MSVVAVLLTIACSQQALPDVSVGYRLEQRCPPKERSEYYFPPAAIADHAITGKWQRDEYSQLLDLIDAAPLWCGDRAPIDTYRLIVLPATASPVVVSAVLNPPGWSIAAATYTVLTSTPSEPGGVRQVISERRSERQATKEQVETFLRALDRANYWAASSYQQPNVEDGTVWTIEARTSGKYGIVSRFVGHDDAFEEAARTLLNLAELQLPK